MPVCWGLPAAGRRRGWRPGPPAPAPDGPAPSEETGEEAGLEVDLRGTGPAASGASGCRGGGVGRFFPVQTEEEPVKGRARLHAKDESSLKVGAWVCAPHRTFWRLVELHPPSPTPPSLLAHPWSRD